MISDKIIKKFDNDFNCNDVEIYLYNINCLIDDINNYINENDFDDINDYKTVNDTIKILNDIKSKYYDVLVIDTPNDDDIITVLCFDDGCLKLFVCMQSYDICCINYSNGYLPCFDDFFQFFKLYQNKKNINVGYDYYFNNTNDYKTFSFYDVSLMFKNILNGWE